jgi:hypothetical protein
MALRSAPPREKAQSLPSRATLPIAPLVLESASRRSPFPCLCLKIVTFLVVFNERMKERSFSMKESLGFAHSRCRLVLAFPRESPRAWLSSRIARPFQRSVVHHHAKPPLSGFISLCSEKLLPLNPVASRPSEDAHLETTRSNEGNPESERARRGDARLCDPSERRLGRPLY